MIQTFVNYDHDPVRLFTALSRHVSLNYLLLVIKSIRIDSYIFISWCLYVEHMIFAKIGPYISMDGH